MDSYAKLARLTAAGPADLERTFVRLAELLGKTPVTARIRAQILECPGTRTWTILSGEGQCRAEDAQGDRPDLEVICHAETWWEIAAGELSPVDAFLGGRMRLRGDPELGKEILKYLSDDGGSCDPCGA